MDAIKDPLVERVVLMWAGQTGKTEVINNIIGYFIDQEPSPMLMVQPTLEMGKTYSKDRLAPMIRDTKALKSLVKEPREKDSSNTVLHKKFIGGHITIAGANSAASLAMRPIRILLLDEIDRYPVSAGVEGDPVLLAEKRTTTFFNRKIIMSGTPTIKGASRIEFAYENSDMQIREVQCPKCKTFQELTWKKHVKWDKDKSGKHLPKTVRCECEKCGFHMTEDMKSNLVAGSRWRATRPFNGTRGCKLGELNSPWTTWEQMVIAFLEVKDKPQLLKVFINTRLAETYEERGDAPDYLRLYARRENYDRNTIPDGGLILIAGVDVQKDRFEVEVVAYGRNLESWSVDYRVYPVDTSKIENFQPLSQMLSEGFVNKNGIEIKINKMVIDSGYETINVYNFGRKMGADRVLVVKGRDGLSSPIAPPKAVDISWSGKTIKKGVYLWGVGVRLIKSELYSFLRMDRNDDQTFPHGYLHYPNYDEEYFKMLTAEELIKKKNKKGYDYWEFVKVRQRNEALDIRVYIRAASIIMGLDRFTENHWDALEQNSINKQGQKKKKKKRRNTGIET